MKNPTAPTININGSNGQRLLDDTVLAIEAVQTAFLAMHEIWPNGRDYQTAPAGAFNTARDEHNARLSNLDTIIKDLEKIAIKIQEQLP